jgi:hypothetical protein
MVSAIQMQQQWKLLSCFHACLDLVVAAQSQQGDGLATL